MTVETDDTRVEHNFMRLIGLPIEVELLDEPWGQSSFCHYFLMGYPTRRSFVRMGISLS
ncbi:MAG: hypothetical protein ACFB14_09990 [Leptolyngbyaceae cyanobacterium]